MPARQRTWDFDMRAIHEFADAMGFPITSTLEFSSTFRGKNRRGRHSV